MSGTNSGNEGTNSGVVAMPTTGTGTTTSTNDSIAEFLRKLLLAQGLLSGGTSNGVGGLTNLGSTSTAGTTNPNLYLQQLLSSLGNVGGTTSV